MRFRESPPNSRLTTLCCILHPAICIDTKSWPRFRLERASTWSESPPFFLLHQYPLPACLFLPVASVLAATLCQSSFSLGPPAPDKRAVDLPETQALIPGPNKGGWTPILLRCIPRPFNTAMTRLSNLLRPGKGQQLRLPRSGFSPRWVMTPPRGRPLGRGSMETVGGACFLARRRRPAASSSLASRKPLSDGLER